MNEIMCLLKAVSKLSKRFLVYVLGIRNRTKTHYLRPGSHVISAALSRKLTLLRKVSAIMSGSLVHCINAPRN